MTAADGLQNALEEPGPRTDSESKREEIWALDQSIGHGNGEEGSKSEGKPKPTTATTDRRLGRLGNESQKLTMALLH